MSSSTHSGAIAVTRVDGEPRVLLVRAKRDPGVWVFPKGHIEPGETAEQAALRELLEEAGFAGRGLERVGASEFVSGGEFVRVEYHLVAVPERSERADSGERREYRWCTWDEASRLLAFDDAKRQLETARQAVEKLIP